jgi:thiamine-monophosphate kinase
MSEMLSLGPGAEFDTIRALLRVWGPRAVGIGDDAAVARLPRGDALVASVDSLVEGRHFRASWLSPREIGYRAIVAAMSDLAAMAARPVGVLVAIGAPDLWRDRLPEVAEGIGDALDLAHTHVLGGNVTGASELSITTTVFGSAFAPLSRRGARVGDQVYITGRLGGPALAIERLSNGESAGEAGDRFLRPVPRLDEARWLAEHGASQALMFPMDSSPMCVIWRTRAEFRSSSTLRKCPAFRASSRSPRFVAGRNTSSSSRCRRHSTRPSSSDGFRSR